MSGGDAKKEKIHSIFAVDWCFLQALQKKGFFLPFCFLCSVFPWQLLDSLIVGVFRLDKFCILPVVAVSARVDSTGFRWIQGG